MRRAGKATLAKQLPNARSVDCALARVRRARDDPELFWRDQSPARGVS